MDIQLLNRVDADVVKTVFRNVDGSGSVTTGFGVCLVAAGASINGVAAVKSTAATWRGFVGVSESDVAINAYGTAITHGYAGSVQLSNVGSSLTVTRGDTLIPSAVAGTFFSSLTSEAISTLLYKFSYSATTPVALSALADSYVAAVIRAI